MASAASSPAASLPDTVVVDASVVLKWLLPEPFSAQAKRLLSGAMTLHVPDLLFPEVANILCRRVRTGEIAADRARALLEWLLELPLQVHATPPLLIAALVIACQYERTVYDSLYLALAVRERTVMVTADEKLYNALAATPLAASLLPVQIL